MFIAIERDLTGALQQGTFILRKNMTPDQLVSALLAPPPGPKFVDIALRTGLRLEQITAKLETLTSLQMDASEFRDIVTSPPAELLADYPWLKKVLADAPKGASLEGFLWPATYRVLPDTTPEELVRLMLDKFEANIGPDRMTVPAASGPDFYQVLTLASIVEREAQLDDGEAADRRGLREPARPEEVAARPAPVRSRPSSTSTIRSSSPRTRSRPGRPTCSGRRSRAGLTGDALPAALAGYNTYTSQGLPPGPICTPTITSIDAALEPDTKDGYLYFIAKGDGTGTSAFAKTAKEHDANVKKYLKP